MYIHMYLNVFPLFSYLPPLTNYKRQKDVRKPSPFLTLKCLLWEKKHLALSSFTVPPQVVDIDSLKLSSSRCDSINITVVSGKSCSLIQELCLPSMAAWGGKGLASLCKSPVSQKLNKLLKRYSAAFYYALTPCSPVPIFLHVFITRRCLECNLYPFSLGAPFYLMKKEELPSRSTVFHWNNLVYSCSNAK